jgi:hypothetical protein
MGVSSITDLSIDNNPLIPETMFASLFVEGDFSIRILSLRANGITSIGTKAIAANLKPNRTVASLNLWHNRIEKDGADALADAIKGNPILFSLNLAFNPIGDEGIINLCMVLSNYLIPSDELASKKKIIAELEMQRMEELGSSKRNIKRRGSTTSGKKQSTKTKFGGADEEKGDPKKKILKKSNRPDVIKSPIGRGSIAALVPEVKKSASNAALGKKGTKLKKGDKALKIEDKIDAEEVPIN